MFNLFRKKKKENTSVEKEEVKKTEEKEETKTTPETKKEEEVKTKETAKTEETEVEEPEKENEPAPTVDSTPEEGNGIPLEQVALKDEVKLWIKEALSAMQAKVDAVEKENTDLKDALAKAKSESDGLRDKYERNGDFGSEQKRGSMFGVKSVSKEKGAVSYKDMWGDSTTFDK